MSRQRACCCSPNWNADSCCVAQTSSGGTTVDRCPREYFVSWTELKSVIEYEWQDLGNCTTPDVGMDGATSTVTIPAGKTRIGFPSQFWEHDGDCRTASSCGISDCSGWMSNVPSGGTSEPCTTTLAGIDTAPENTSYGRTNAYMSHFWWPRSSSTGPQGNYRRQGCCSDTELPYVIGDYNSCNTISGSVVHPNTPNSVCWSEVQWDGQYCVRDLKSQRWTMACKRCNDSGSGVTQNGKVYTLRTEAQWSRDVTGTPGGTNYCNDPVPNLGDQLTSSTKGDFTVTNNLGQYCYQCPVAMGNNSYTQVLSKLFVFMAVDRSDGFTACPHELEWSLVGSNHGSGWQNRCLTAGGTETITGSIQLTVI